MVHLLTAYLAAATPQSVDFSGVVAFWNLVVKIITVLPRQVAGIAILVTASAGSKLWPAVLMGILLGIPDTLPNSSVAFELALGALLASLTGMVAMAYGVLSIRGSEDHHMVLGVILMFVGAAALLTSGGVRA